MSCQIHNVNNVCITSACERVRVRVFVLKSFICLPIKLQYLFPPFYLFKRYCVPTYDTHVCWRF